MPRKTIKFTQGTLTIVRRDYDDYEISRTDEKVAAIYLISGIEAEGVDPECRCAIRCWRCRTRERRAP